MAAFLLRRLGFMILTLLLLSLIIFFAGQVLPGDPGRAVLGPSRRARARCRRSTTSSAWTSRCSTRYLNWLGGLLHGDLGTSYSYRSRGRAVRPGRADQLAQAGRARVRDRGAARHRRRRDRRALRGPRGGPDHLRDRALPGQRARVRVRDRADRGVRRGAEGCLPVTASAGAGRGRLQPVPAPDPARDPARLGAVRLHRPYGQGGDHRGAELRLRPDRGAQGAAAGDRDPAARAAQLAAADDHGHRDPDRVPDRRPGGGRDAVQLPGPRQPDLQGRGTARTSRCWRPGSSSSAWSTWWPR